MAAQLDSGIHPATTDTDFDMLSDSGTGLVGADVDFELDDAPDEDVSDQDVDLDDAAEHHEQGEPPHQSASNDELMLEDYDDNIVEAEMQDSEPVLDHTADPLDIQHHEWAPRDGDTGTHTAHRAETQHDDWAQTEWDSTVAEESADVPALDDTADPVAAPLTVTDSSHVATSAGPGDVAAWYDPSIVQGTGEEPENRPAAERASSDATDDYNAADDTLENEVSEALDDAEEPAEADSERQIYAGEDDVNSLQYDDSYDEEDGQSLIYSATLHYDGQVSSLFPVIVDGITSRERHLLPDDSLVGVPLHEFLQECKDALGVSNDQALYMSIPALDLIISDLDNHCAHVTMAQIIDLYYNLHSNEGTYEPSQIHLMVSSQPKFSSQLNSLFAAVEAGTGISAYFGSFKENGDEDESDGFHDGGDDVEVNASYDENLTNKDDADRADAVDQHPSSTTPSGNDDFRRTAEPQRDGLETDGKGVQNQDQGTISEILAAELSGLAENDKMIHVSEVLTAKLVTTSQETNSPPADADEDLIDYSDDDDEPYSGTSRSSTILGERVLKGTASLNTSNSDVTPLARAPAASSSVSATANQPTSIEPSNRVLEDEDGILLDIEIQHTQTSTTVKAGDVETKSSPMAAIQAEEPKAAPISTFSLKDSEDDVLLEFDDDDEILKTAIATGVSSGAGPANSHMANQDEIDFDDDDFDFPSKKDIQVTTGDGDSPLGKRTWDDHAAGEMAAGDNQDAKRVKPT